MGQGGVAAGRGGGAEGAAVEVLQAQFGTPAALTLPGPTATSSSSPRVVSMVPPMQFTLSVADVPVVQSLPLVLVQLQLPDSGRCPCCTGMVVHSLEGTQAWGSAL